MSTPNVVFHCEACGKPHPLYIGQIPFQKLQDENKSLQEERLYLDQLCNSLNDRLAVAEAMAAWDSSDGISIADLLG